MNSNAVQTKEKQVEGALSTLRASFTSHTDPVATLVQKRKEQKIKTKKKTNQTMDLSRHRKEKKMGHSSCPQSRKDKFIHGEEAVSESCPNTAL